MTDTSQRPAPVVLCILDGWGHRTETENNAIALATTPTWDHMLADYPHALIETSGDDVGLPAGQMGNSEVGHMNIGAGRVVLQDLPMIDAAIEDGSLSEKASLTSFIEKLKASGGTCHLLGLASPGGVHSHQRHITALAKIVSDAGIPVAIHAFLDGRDTGPKTAKGFIKTLEGSFADMTNVRLATLSGRYYAMDRDKRWDRVEKAYAALANGSGGVFTDAQDAIEASYADDKTDEFMIPTVRDGYAGMQDGDGILMANFRADRAREILTALLDPEFDGFKRSRTVAFDAALGMVEYSSALNPFIGTIFSGDAPPNTLGEVLSDAGLTQLRIAETEKYAHVTFFLNGGTEDEFKGEQRIMIPSPDVATYDEAPAMSAVEVTDKIVDSIENHQHDVIIVNYANGDMVGHTGVLDAAIEAATTIDSCLKRLEDAVIAAGGTMLVTADHGNCEMMVDEDGGPHTQHTVGVVPAVLVNPPAGIETLSDGRLADIAPTILALLNLRQPSDMTGHALTLDAEPERARATA